MVKGFNKDMDRYLRSRRDNKISIRFGKNSRVERVPEVKDDEMTIEEKEPSFWTRFFRSKKQIPEDELTPEERAKLERMEAEIQAVEEAEEMATDPEEIEMLEEAREGLLSRFFSSLRLFQRKHELDEEAEAVMTAEEELARKEAEMDTDTKEVLKITHAWLGKLSKRNREAFLESDDYKKYKAILKKYKVAK